MITETANLNPVPKLIIQIITFSCYKFEFIFSMLRHQLFKVVTTYPQWRPKQ